MTATGNAARRTVWIHAVRVDAGAKQPVRGKGAGKSECVRDEKQ